MTPVVVSRAGTSSPHAQLLLSHVWCRCWVACQHAVTIGLCTLLIVYVCQQPEAQEFCCQERWGLGEAVGAWQVQLPEQHENYYRASVDWRSNPRENSLRTRSLCFAPEFYIAHHMCGVFVCSARLSWGTYVDFCHSEPSPLILLLYMQDLEGAPRCVAVYRHWGIGAL